MPRFDFAAAVAALVAACSSHAPAISTSDAPVAMTDAGVDVPAVDALSAAEACSALASERCGMLGSCSANDLVKQFGSADTCIQRESLACRESLDAADTGATPGAMIACGSALAAESCDAFLGPGSPPACVQVGPGTGTCTFEAQCATSFCAIGANALCGICAATPVAGASCAVASCGPTLVCDDNDDQCAAPAQAGQPCNKTIPCDHGLACVGDTNTQNGMCEAQVTVLGSACDSTRKTRPTCSADDGLTCNTSTSKCVAQPLAAAGSACGAIGNVDTACTAGATCVIPTNQTTGTCVAPAADGSACSTGSAGPDCFFPARCVPTGSGSAGTCQLPGSQSC